MYTFHWEYHYFASQNMNRISLTSWISNKWPKFDFFKKFFQRTILNDDSWLLYEYSHFLLSFKSVSPGKKPRAVIQWVTAIKELAVLTSYFLFWKCLFLCLPFIGQFTIKCAIHCMPAFELRRSWTHAFFINVWCVFIWKRRCLQIVEWLTLFVYISNCW